MVVTPTGRVHAEIDAYEQIIEPLFGEDIPESVKFDKLSKMKVEKVSIDMKFFTFNFGAQEEEDGVREVRSSRNVIFQLYDCNNWKHPYFLPFQAYNLNSLNLAKVNEVNQEINNLVDPFILQADNDGMPNEKFPLSNKVVEFMQQEEADFCSFDYDLTVNGCLVALKVGRANPRQSFIQINNKKLDPNQDLYQALD